MKKLVLIRHAHRDTSKGREQDNGLDALGKKQRKELTKFFLKKFAHESIEIYSSPLKRCLQTVKKISENLNVPLYSALELTERGQLKRGESEREFQNRIGKFLGKVRRSKKEVVVLCCHGDWIPEALDKLIGCPIELKKGAWVQLESKKSRIQLETLIQSFSSL